MRTLFHKRRRHGTRLLLIVGSISTAWCGLTYSGQVRPLNLERLTERAALVFEGRCLQTSATFDTTLGREVTTATFDVARLVKGDAAETVTIRMLGGNRGRPTADDDVARGARFRVGEDVILFLYGRSELGLTSPVGLGQGRFSIVEHKSGLRIAVNDFGNRHLFNGLSPDAQSRIGPALSEWRRVEGVETVVLMDMVESLTD